MPVAPERIARPGRHIGYGASIADQAMVAVPQAQEVMFLGVPLA